jgi:hypothetical protein
MNLDKEINKLRKKEIVAIIAYLQRLGVDIKAENEANAAAAPAKPAASDSTNNLKE